MHYLITAYVNVSEDPWGHSTGMMDGYKAGDKLATVGWYSVKGVHEDTAAAEAMFAIGNRIRPDHEELEWPSDVRSLSVGDVLVLAYGDESVTDHVAYLAVDRFGWKTIDPVKDGQIVELAGTNATSRVKAEQV